MNQTKGKNLFKNSILYFFGNVLSRIISFLMIPLYTRHIPAADFGFYDTVIALVTFIAGVIFLDVGAGTMRYMFEGKTKEDKNKAVYSGVTIFGLSFAVYLILAFIIGFSFSIDHFIWVVVLGFLISLTAFYSFAARGHEANTLFAISGVVASIAIVVSNLIFIFAFNMDYRLLYISASIGMITQIIMLEAKCKLILNFKRKYLDKDMVKALFKFILPLSVNTAAFWMLNSANRLIVTLMLGAEANGILAIANKFTAILFLISMAFQLAWQEFAFKRGGSKGDAATGEFYSKTFNLFFLFVILGTMVVLPAIQIGLTVLPGFIDAAYRDSIHLIPIAISGAVMSIAGAFLGSVFGAVKKNNYVLISTSVGAAVNIASIFILIHLGVGVMSAPIALLLGFSAALLTRTIVLRKIIGLKANYFYFAIAIALITGSYFAFNYLDWYFNLLIGFVFGMLLIRLLYKNFKSLPIIQKTTVRFSVAKKFKKVKKEDIKILVFNTADFKDISFAGKFIEITVDEVLYGINKIQEKIGVNDIFLVNAGDAETAGQEAVRKLISAFPDNIFFTGAQSSLCTALEVNPHAKIKLYSNIQEIMIEYL